MQDGLVLMYVKNDILYPVGLTKKEIDLLQDLGRVFEPIKVSFDHPEGKATILKRKYLN